MQTEVETLRKWVTNCAQGRMVFFGGAGVSTESGIPDFRSPDGLYAQKYGDMPPEEMISRTYFDRHPEQFFEFYFDRMIARGAEPNQAHLKLADLELGSASVKAWAKVGIEKVSDVLNPNDVILVQEKKGLYLLQQIPAVEGALIALDPHTGRVLAMTGGYSFEKNQFNRAIQAARQPGSSFKPFVYLAS